MTCTQPFTDGLHVIEKQSLQSELTSPLPSIALIASRWRSLTAITERGRTEPEFVDSRSAAADKNCILKPANRQLKL